MSETSILSAPAALPSAATKAIETFETELANEMAKPHNQQTFDAIPVLMFPDHVEIEIQPGNKKHIGWANFKELVAKSLNQVMESPIITGLLPPSNTIFMSQTETNMYLNCYFPGAIREMQYGTATNKMNIVTPNIILCHTLRKESGDWTVTNTHYFCTDLPIGKLPKTFINNPEASKGIYDLPMSNTYGGGRMCYGGNNMPARFKDGNLRGLDWYFTYLWTTPFNDDLGVRAINTGMRPGQWYSHLAKLAKDNKGFPYRDLSGWRAIDGAVPSDPPTGRAARS